MSAAVTPPLSDTPAILDRAISSNRELQSLASTRLGELEERLRYLSSVRAWLVADSQNEASAAISSRKRARHNTNTVATLHRREKPDGDEVPDTSVSQPACSQHVLCAYPERPASITMRTVMLGSGTSGDPFREAGTFIYSQRRIVQFAPVPTTTDAARQRRLDAAYPPDCWTQRSATVLLPLSRAPSSQADAHTDERFKGLLAAFAQRYRNASFVRVLDGKASAPSMEDAINKARQAGAPVEDVMTAHWGDTTHLRQYLCAFVLHFYQLHYPRSEWLSRFMRIVNLPLRNVAASLPEERARFASLVTCAENDLVALPAAAASECLFLRTVHDALRTARCERNTHVPELMVRLLSESGVVQSTAVPYASHKCQQLLRAIVPVTPM